MKIDQVKAGMILIADEWFTCLKSGERCLVKADDYGELYITCSTGRHYLDGQVHYDGELLGLNLEDRS